MKTNAAKDALDQAAMQQRENAQAVRPVIGETPVKKMLIQLRIIVLLFNNSATRQRADVANTKAVIGKMTALNLVQ